MSTQTTLWLMRFLLRIDHRFSVINAQPSFGEYMERQDQ
jgi:hypothetical protein